MTMGLSLRIVSRHRQGLGEESVKVFGHDGGTIGRSMDCDWPLPDGHRYVSSRHASIDYRSGSYYIVDMSTNGVYVNASDSPVGRGTPQRLFSGDRIRIGEYEFAVEIDDEDDTGEQFKEDHVDPVDANQRVAPPDPTRPDMLQPHEITVVGLDILLDEQANTDQIRQAAALSVENMRLVDDPPPRAQAADAAVAPDAREKSAAKATASAAATKRAPEPPPVSAALQMAKAQVTAQPKPPPATQAKPPASAAAKAPAKSAEAPAAKTPKSAEAPAASAKPSKPAEPPATKASAKPAEPAAKTAPAAGSAAASPPAPTTTTPANVSMTAPTAGMAAALEPFFRGAGMSGEKLDDKQAAELLHRLGQLMRETILGLSDNLHVRAEQKSALRVPNTTIQPRANNPLKFSAGVEEALRNLLLRQSTEYLTAVEAVREAFRDVKIHQQSLLAALRVAIADYLTRLDPEDIENKYNGSKRGSLMSAANKLRYWDLYKDLYQVVTQAPPGQLPQLLVEDLLRAYEHEETKAAGAGAKKTQAQAG